MEKRNAHCPLPVVQLLVNQGHVRATASALRGAAELDFDFDDMLNTIRSLKVSNFYKSMTTIADHTIWQDVYHAQTPMGDVYLKLTVIDDVLIVSFKEL